MKFVAFLGLLSVSAASAACDIPTVVFDGPGGTTTTTSPTGGAGGSAGTSSTGGGGTGSGQTTSSGSGGSGGGSGGATAGGSGGAMSSGSGGTFTGPQVPCTQTGELCAVDQICCFHDTDAALDHCGQPGTCCPDVGVNPPCETSYLYFACNGLEDCPNGKCCGGLTGMYLSSTYCGTDCMGMNEILMCKSNEGECGAGKTCTPILDGYPGYSYCK